MRALSLVADRQLVVAETPSPAPGAGEVQIRVKAVALNHIDVWGYRGMAFAKRKLPLVVGAEASGEIASVGDGVTRFRPGQKVVSAALTCGVCRRVRPAAIICARTWPGSWDFMSTVLHANS